MEGVATACGATSTAISACLYLVDFGTTLITLRTYYRYQYRCPHAPLGSPLLHDPICRAISSGGGVYDPIGAAFWMCLYALAFAHVVYALVFWITFDPLQHPLRLVYFMPLVHLFRLLKLLFNSCSMKDLKELQERQQEASALYNIIGASLESAAQFIIQFYVVFKLGVFVKGSADKNVLQAQKIPLSLSISITASLTSSTYSTGKAISSILASQLVPLPYHTTVGFVAGSLSGYKRHDEDASQETKTPAETKDDGKEDSLEKPDEVEVKDAITIVAHNRKGASNSRAKRCLAS